MADRSAGQAERGYKNLKYLFPKPSHNTTLQIKGNLPTVRPAILIAALNMGAFACRRGAFAEFSGQNTRQGRRVYEEVPPGRAIMHIAASGMGVQYDPAQDG